MTHRRTDLAECHQSDATCLARFHHNATTDEPSGHAATVGTLAHEIIEAYTYAQASTPSIDPMSVVREVLAARLADPEVTHSVVEDCVAIMAGAFGKNSDLDFRLRDGWTIVPEWRWALDEGLQPIAPCAVCLQAPRADEILECNECLRDGRRGWSSKPAHAGTIDRLQWSDKVAVIIVDDWKSSLIHESGDDVRGDRQARRYALAVLAHFPNATAVRFRKVFLRHGYPAPWTFVRDEPWHTATALAMKAQRTKRLAAIAADQWPETMGEDCDYCPLIFRCEAQKLRRLTGSEPTEPLEQQVNVLLGLRTHVKALESRLRLHVDVHGPIPMKDDEGHVFGGKPLDGWRVTKDYEQTLADLDALQMTPEQRVEWFRFCAKHHFAGRVKKALETLVGRQSAKQWIEAGEWLEPMTETEFSMWLPPETAAPSVGPATIEDLDDLIDRAMGGG